MIEARWRTHWQAAELYRTDLDASQQPFYNLVEFPYPSGEGLHVGHVYTYAGADTVIMRSRCFVSSVLSTRTSGKSRGIDSIGIENLRSA